jgi:hypothetical protein
MKYAGITNKVLKRFAKQVPDKGKFALREITGARNPAERSALKRIEKAGVFVKVGPGIYQRTSVDPVKEYYGQRQKGWAKRGGPGVSKQKKQWAKNPVPISLKASQHSVPDFSITPWGEDDLFLVRIGNRRILGPEVVVVKKGNGTDEI